MRGRLIRAFAAAALLLVIFTGSANADQLCVQTRIWQNGAPSPGPGHCQDTPLSEFARYENDFVHPPTGLGVGFTVVVVGR